VSGSLVATLACPQAESPKLTQRAAMIATYVGHFSNRAVTDERLKLPEVLLMIAI
jgi:hypothetical protein